MLPHTYQRLTMGLIGVITLGVGWAVAQSRQEAVAPDTLLPASSSIYFQWDGINEHEDTWKNTAAYESLVKSGLAEAFKKVIASVGAQAQQDPQAAKAYDMLISAANSVWNNGVSFGASATITDPPFGVFVFHNAAAMIGPLTELILDVSRGQADLNERDIQDRAVTSTMIPDSPVEVAWWSEGGHLLVAVGINPAQQAIAIAAGDSPNVTTHRLYAKYHEADAGFVQTTTGWLDFKTLRETFGGVPLPFPVAEGDPPVQVNHLLAALGLDALSEVAARSGFEGRSCTAETFVISPGKRRGLMELTDQQPITLADLPPLPTGMSSLWAASFDISGGVESVISVIRSVADFAPSGARENLERDLAGIEDELAINVQEDLLKPLGDVLCLYNDTSQGAFGSGLAVVVKVESAARLRATFDHLFERLAIESRGQASVQNVDKLGRRVSMLQFEGVPFAPALCIDKEWMVIGVSPQMVESFLMRLDGDLARWEPNDEVNAALAEMPQEFVSLSISDPRPGYKMMLTWGPMVAGMAQTWLRQERAVPPGFEMPFNASDIPPAERVIDPLHINIAMQTQTEDGIKLHARTSLSGIPMMGGGGGGGVATSAVLVALLLPAVQQAREAARRTQSNNNLKMLGLAMHNYHDTFGNFPQGAVPNDQLKTDQRLSWLVSVLPYLEQAPLYNQFDMQSGWKSDANADLARHPIEKFVNPSVGPQGGQFPTTQYAGCAGVGEDGPTLAVDHKRAGIFAYDRATRMRDITDGTSNTIAVFEVDQNLGPWAQGGASTIRPLTQKPYIHGPDGIGGQHAGGAAVLLGDGSVRFISENIDPKVMESLSTIAGGEVIGDF